MSSRSSRHAIVAIACTLVAFVARTGVAQSGAIDPCSLLTADQVKAVFGVAVDAGAPISKTACLWKASGTARQRATVALEPGDSWEKLKVSLPTAPKKPLSGVGDDAFYENFGAFSSLGVKKGNTVFIIRVYGVDAVDKQEAYEKALAVDVVKKL